MSAPKCDDCGKTALLHQCKACALGDLNKIGDQIADLMARLKAVRAMTTYFRVDRDDPWLEMDAATDLRRKNWKETSRKKATRRSRP